MSVDKDIIDKARELSFVHWKSGATHQQVEGAVIGDLFTAIRRGRGVAVAFVSTISMLLHSWI